MLSFPISINDPNLKWIWIKKNVAYKSPCRILNKHTFNINLKHICILNALRPKQNDRHFVDSISKWIFFDEDVWTLLKISLKFVPKVRINNIPAMVQIMAWRWQDDMPLSEPMMVSLLTHIYVSLSLNEVICNCTMTTATAYMHSVNHIANKLWPSNFIWHWRFRSTLDQVKAYLLTAPSHYLNQCWLIIVNWTLGNKLHWNSNQNTNIFYQENTIKNVVSKMVTILFGPQCVKYAAS